MSKGKAMDVITIDFIVKLEHALLVIKVINIQVFKHKGLHPIHKLGFAKVKCFNSLEGILGKTSHNLVTKNIGDTQSQAHP
jgi:hypothetical protein